MIDGDMLWRLNRQITKIMQITENAAFNIVMLKYMYRLKSAMRSFYTIVNPNTTIERKEAMAIEIAINFLTLFSLDANGFLRTK